ncbi:hypothetical protein T01_14382 [Trichinella spiralis]|uniref:Uncharacterized protein n=1 Tax=Trichinella spiralis TaxID=6334 RepID=A0A0V1ATR5_TRISP|nr:hypothetical protein T01_14382 [Trichinella spiralis]
MVQFQLTAERLQTLFIKDAQMGSIKLPFCGRFSRSVLLHRDHLSAARKSRRNGKDRFVELHFLVLLKQNQI